MRTRRSVGFLVSLAIVLASLLATPVAQATPVPPPGGDPQPKCYSDPDPVNGVPDFPYNFSIYFHYVNSSHTALCGYPTQYSWLASTRDSTVRGQHGEYSEIDVSDGRLSTGEIQVIAYFDGGTDPKNRYVKLGGRSYGDEFGWSSQSKTVCKGGGFTGGGSSGRESKALADFVYHVGEVSRTNSQGYQGSKVYEALITTSGSNPNRILYSPNPACYTS